MIRNNPADWPPPPERLQPMDDDEPRRFPRWLTALVLAVILGGLAYGYTLAPGVTECDDSPVACGHERPVGP